VAINGDATFLVAPAADAYEGAWVTAVEFGAGMGFCWLAVEVIDSDLYFA
jgi:hypothetical protein